VQRDVARALGWLPRLEPGELEHMTDAQAAARFRTLDVASMTDMWRRAQPWCEKLRRAGRLESVAALLGISYVNEFHPSDDVNYYLERCARVGDFKAWCTLDRVAAQMARQHGLMPEVRRRAPKRPAEGYLTSGGYCASLAELAVARLLEANGVEFRTQVDYQCRGVRKQQRLKCGVIQRRRQWPAQPRSHRALHVLGDRPLGYAHGRGDALVTKTCLKLQAENFLNLAHGFPLGRHPSPDKKSGRITRLS
jgi:hypothetical protein